MTAMQVQTTLLHCPKTDATLQLLTGTSWGKVVALPLYRASRPETIKFIELRLQLTTGWPHLEAQTIDVYQNTSRLYQFAWPERCCTQLCLACYACCALEGSALVVASDGCSSSLHSCLSDLPVWTGTST